MSTQTASYIEAIEHLPKGAILRLPHVSWEDYEQLLADLGDDYHVRVSYACGWLEIMSPLPEHGEFAEVVQDIAREITRELGVKLEARGSMTIRSAWQAKARSQIPVSMCRTPRVSSGSAASTSTLIHHLTLWLRSTSPTPHNPSFLYMPPWVCLKSGVTMAVRRIFIISQANSMLRQSHSQAFPFLSSTVLAQLIEQSKTEGQDAALDAAREWVRVNKPVGNS